MLFSYRRVIEWQTTTSLENSLDRAAGKTVRISICRKIVQFGSFICTVLNQFTTRRISMVIPTEFFIDNWIYGGLYHIKAKLDIMQNIWKMFHQTFI